MQIFTPQNGAYLHFTVVLNAGGETAQSCRNDCSIRAVEVRNPGRNTQQEIIAAYFEKNTVVERDGYKCYLNLKDVEVRGKKHATGDLHWFHTVLSDLKNLLRGTYHGRCTELQPYLDERYFRFNRRMRTGQLFSRLTRAVATSGSLPS